MALLPRHGIVQIVDPAPVNPFNRLPRWSPPYWPWGHTKAAAKAPAYSVYDFLSDHACRSNGLRAQGIVRAVESICSNASLNNSPGLIAALEPDS